MKRFLVAALVVFMVLPLVVRNSEAKDPKDQLYIEVSALGTWIIFTITNWG